MTPTGLLQKGDRIRHKESGIVATVVKRDGNDAIYSVILKPDKWFPGTREAYGFPGCYRLLEAAYWLHCGVYEYLPDDSR